MSNTVPGLSRGIHIIELLARGGPASLDEIAAATEYPRTSVHRILTTLVSLDIIEKSPETRLYHAIQSLQPLGGGNREGFEEKLAETMARLAEGSGQTTEWYVELEEGAVLVRRDLPPGSEVHIIAQPGFLRPRQGELDAVAQVLRAFSAEEHNRWGGMWTYQGDGQKGRLKAAAARRLVQEARAERIGSDPHFNSNGIRRIATPVLRENGLVGILALAMCYTPDWQEKEPTLRSKLKDAAESLEKAN